MKQNVIHYRNWQKKKVGKLCLDTDTKITFSYERLHILHNHEHLLWRLLIEYSEPQNPFTLQPEQSQSIKLRKFSWKNFTSIKGYSYLNK